MKGNTQPLSIAEDLGDSGVNSSVAFVGDTFWDSTVVAISDVLAVAEATVVVVVTWNGKENINDDSVLSLKKIWFWSFFFVNV